MKEQERGKERATSDRREDDDHATRFSSSTLIIGKIDSKTALLSVSGLVPEPSRKVEKDGATQGKAGTRNVAAKCYKIMYV
jgi:hypothetical protein